MAPRLLFRLQKLPMCAVDTQTLGMERQRVGAHHECRPESAQTFWRSAEGDCTGCRVQCSLCCKWRIVTYEALQQVCKATSWTCLQLRSVPSLSVH